MKASGLGRGFLAVLPAILVTGATDPAPADVFSLDSGGAYLQMVTVGDPGNQPDTRYVAGGIGRVNETYQIAKYPVTNTQYCDFLNAVAGMDTYQVYNWNTGIARTAVKGGYVYTVRPGFANRPVDYVSWAAAARFCNWLTNGQPTGAQGPATTEDGAYRLSGAVTDDALQSVRRKAGFVIPSADEWYKAAYYKGGSTDAGYWNYATQSDTVPLCQLPPGDPGAANYYLNGYIDPTFLVTEVGAYANSPSAYGTFDQAGNIYEWTEATIAGRRVLRGGSYYDPAAAMKASSSLAFYPSYADSTSGFRVAFVPTPEPTTLVMLAVALMGLAIHRKDAK